VLSKDRGGSYIRVQKLLVMGWKRSVNLLYFLGRKVAPSTTILRSALNTGSTLPNP